MRIDAVQLFRVPVPASPAPSGGARRESVLVLLTSGGQSGWGEVVLGAGPSDDAEWAAGAFLCLRDWLAPAVAGRAIDSGDDLQRSLSAFQGNPRAKSALDIAWWNLAVAMKGVPLARLLGGEERPLAVMPSFEPTESFDEFLDGIAAAFAAGYESVSLKFRPGWDLQMVRGVRQRFGSEPIAIDCDGQCSLGQTEMFYRLEDFMLQSIEQPLPADDLVGHAMLQSALKTPLCLDQSVTSLERVEQAIDLASCRQMRVDVARVGGLTPALAIAKACHEAGIACAARIDSQPIAGTASLALVTSPAFTQPVEFGGWNVPPWLKAAEVPQPDRGPSGRQEFAAAAVLSSRLGVDESALASAALESAKIG